MRSDEDDCILVLVRTDRDAVRHFDLIKAGEKVSFEAILDVKGAPYWRVVRILAKKRESEVGALKVLSDDEKAEVARLVHSSLRDFGVFFGDQAGSVAVMIDDKAIAS